MNLPAFLWSIILLALFSALAYLVGRLVRRPGLWYLPHAVALVGLLAAWVPFVLAAMQLARGDAPAYRLGSVSLSMDALSLLLCALVLGLGTQVALFTGP